MNGADANGLRIVDTRAIEVVREREGVPTERVGFAVELGRSHVGPHSDAWVPGDWAAFTVHPMADEPFPHQIGTFAGPAAAYNAIVNEERRLDEQAALLALEGDV